MKNNNLLKSILKKLTCFVLAAFIALQFVPEGALEIKAASNIGQIEVIELKTGKRKKLETFDNLTTFRNLINKWGDEDYRINIWMWQDWNFDYHVRNIQLDEGQFYLYMNGYMIDFEMVNMNLALVNSIPGDGPEGIFDVTDGATFTIDGGTGNGIGDRVHTGKINTSYNSRGVFTTDMSSNGETKTYTGGLITGGYSTDTGQGGCITTSGGSKVKLYNVTISGNIASYGGAIYLYSKNDSLYMSNSKIEYNLSTNYGGGIYSEGDNNNISIVNGSSLSHNTAKVKDGGAIFSNEYGVSINIENSKVEYNYAGHNGGAFGFDDDKIRINVSNSHVDNNVANQNGGAIYFDDDAYNSAIYLKCSSTISNNTASNYGGAVFMKNKGALTVQSADNTGSISNNTAGYRGGGLYLYLYATISNDYGDILVKGLNISNNTANGTTKEQNGGYFDKVDGGGGIFFVHYRVGDLDEHPYPLTIEDCTLQENKAINGGGIYCEPVTQGDFGNNPLKVKNTTITNNKAGYKGGGIYTKYSCFEGIVNVNNNKLTDGTTSNLYLIETLSTKNFSSLSNIGITSKDSSSGYVLTDNTSSNYPQESFFSDVNSLLVKSDTTSSAKNRLVIASNSRGNLRVNIKNPITNETTDITESAYASDGSYIKFNAYSILGLDTNTYQFIGWNKIITSNGDITLNSTSPNYSSTSFNKNLTYMTFQPKFVKKVKDITVTMDGNGSFNEVFKDVDGIEIKNTNGYSVSYNYHENNEFTVSITYKENANNGIYFSNQATGTFALKEGSGLTLVESEDNKTVYNAAEDSITITQRLKRESTEQETVNVKVSCYDVNDTNNDLSTNTTTVTKSTETTIYAPEKEGYVFKEWKDSNGESLGDGYTVDGNTVKFTPTENVDLKAYYTPAITSISGTLADLEVGKSLPSLTDAKATIGTTSNISINTISVWSKYNTETNEWDSISEGYLVEDDTTYKVKISPTTSEQVPNEVDISDNITITINGNVLTKEDIQESTTKASVPEGVSSKIRPLRIFKDTKEDSDNKYIEYLLRTPAKEDKNLSAILPLDDVTLERGKSVTSDNLPSKVTVKLKNGTTTEVDVTWTDNYSSYNYSQDDPTDLVVSGTITYDLNSDNVSTTITKTFHVPGNPDKLSAPTVDREAGDSVENAITYKGSVYFNLLSSNDEDIIYYTATSDGSEPEDPTSSSERKVFNFEDGYIKIVAPQDDSTKTVRVKTYAAPVEGSSNKASNVKEYVYKVVSDGWYTVSFNFDGGSDKDVGGGVYTMPLVEKGDCIYFKDEPTKSGYSFAGWLGSDGKTYQIADLLKLNPDTLGEKATGITFKALWKTLTPDTSDSTNIPLWAGTTLVSLAIVGLLLKKKISDQLS